MQIELTHKNFGISYIKRFVRLRTDDGDLDISFDSKIMKRDPREGDIAEISDSDGIILRVPEDVEGLDEGTSSDPDLEEEFVDYKEEVIDEEMDDEDFEDGFMFIDDEGDHETSEVIDILADPVAPATPDIEFQDEEVEAIADPDGIDLDGDGDTDISIVDVTEEVTTLPIT